jgi:hypothetical protein
MAGLCPTFRGLWRQNGVEGLQGAGEEQGGIMGKIIEIFSKCSFSWEKLKEMKDKETKFWAADGLNLLQIVDIDEKRRTFYVINQSGKITWPLKYQKLEEVHNKFHNGEIALLAYEIDKLVPTWGNYIAGLLKYIGCEITQLST